MLLYGVIMRQIKKAVAIEYKKTNQALPKISAIGKGDVAEAIIKLAKMNKIAVAENEFLVETLSKFKIYSVIPIETFSAVAEILSFVYKLNPNRGDYEKHE